MSSLPSDKRRIRFNFEVLNAETGEVVQSYSNADEPLENLPNNAVFGAVSTVKGGGGGNAMFVASDEAQTYYLLRLVEAMTIGKRVNQAVMQIALKEAQRSKGIIT